MKRLTLILLLASGCLLYNTLPVSAADLGIEFQVQRGTNENLFGDSSNTFDAYTTSELNFSYYPLSQVKVGFSGSHTYYHETVDLSNLLGQFDISFIPLPESSPILIQLNGSLNGVVYHQQYSHFDNNYVQGEIIAGYQLTPSILVRSGILVASTAYINSETGDKRDIEVFLGGNFTLPGRNSLDLEAGLATTNYAHKDNIFFDDSIAPGNIFPTPYEDWFLDWVGQGESDLRTFYWSPRLSRPIGFKSGINITYARRIFQNYDDQLLLGFTTEYLSPWASVWEGENISASLKSYLIPRTIFLFGIGYWDKTYLKTIEPNAYYYIDERIRPARRDFQRRYYISASWPLLARNGIYFEPNLRIDYTRSKSNQATYGYSNYTVVIGLIVRL